MSAKEFVRPVYANGRRLVRTASNSVASALNSNPRVVHQGIQRSGTNYLCKLLFDAGFFVQNSVDPRRDNPRHKHFRWQDDKSTIVMDPAFSNSLSAGSIGELNTKARFPPGIKHVVIFKKPAPWLVSIHRWGAANGWVDAQSHLLESPEILRSWLREWDAYHGKWFSLAQQEPSRVLILCYEDLAGDVSATVGRVQDFMGVEESLRAVPDGRVKKVAHSSPRNAAQPPAPVPEIESLVNETVDQRWKTHVRQSTS